MTLEILIVTSPERHLFMGQLLSILEPQIAGRYNDVDLRISASDLDLPIGERREKLRQRATADYICFIDSDDLVPMNYVSSIVPLLDGVDYIGFEIKMFYHQREIKPAYHDLAYKEWTEDEHAYYRDIGHVNPMRRELALQRPMEGGIGEDSRWANQMRGLVKTSHYIPEPLYWYIIRPSKNDADDPISTWRLDLIKQLRMGSL
jgi:hypothetical protein